MVSVSSLSSDLPRPFHTVLVNISFSFFLVWSLNIFLPEVVESTNFKSTDRETLLSC
jgi:hypothetical protein